MAPPEVAGQASGEEDSLAVSGGNVILAVMVRMNELRGGQCGNFSLLSLQELMALVWFVDAVNTAGYIPGVTIGLEAYRTCRLPAKAAQGAVRLLQKYRVGQDSSVQQQQPLLFGMLGPDATAEASVVSRLIGYLPANQRLVQISGSATGKELSDKELHPNFFRVVANDHVQIKVMARLLAALDWNYVAVVYDDDDYGQSAASKLRKLLEDRNICVPLYAELPLDIRSSQFDTAAKSVAQKLQSPEQGPIRGVVVVASPSSTRQLLHTLNASLVPSPQLVLSEAVGLNLATLQQHHTGRLLPLAAGALLTTPPHIPAPEFEAFWTHLWTNRTVFSHHARRLPWLEAYFVQLTGCPSNVECWEKSLNLLAAQRMGEGGQRNASVGYALKAAAVMVELLKQMQRDKCGEGHTGVCQDLSSSITGRQHVQDALQAATLNLAGLSSLVGAFRSETSVRFDSDGDVVVDKGVTAYMVYNLVRGTGDEYSFREIGEFQGNTLKMDTEQAEFYDRNDHPLTWEQLPHAQCDDDHDCLHCVRDVSADVMFVEGDFYVIALVPVSARSWEVPLMCGGVKGREGADVAQAMRLAVEKAVQPSRTVGLVVINTCGSPLHVRQRLTDLYAGRLVLGGERNSSLVLERVVGVVVLATADDTDSSLAAYDTLTHLQTTFVQVSATPTPLQQDRSKYPYLMRLVPVDDTQVQVMLDIVQTLGADHIQVIYDSSSAYATGLFQKLQEESRSDRYNICIAQSIPTTPSSHHGHIAIRLREKSSTRVVVILLNDSLIHNVMAAILPLLLLTSDDDHHFRFLWGDAWWGRRGNVTMPEGSLVLAPGVHGDPVFQHDFTTSVDPTQSSNPWLPAFWEARLGCFMDKSFQRRGRRPCPKNMAADYEQDSPAVPLSILSARALLKGFHAALTRHCGANASRVCRGLTSSRLAEAVRGVEVEVQSGGADTRVFDSSGDVVGVGYEVLQVESGSQDDGASSGSDGERLVYRTVGTWMKATGLSVNQDKLVPLEKDHSERPSSCPALNHDGDLCSSNPSSSTGSDGLSVSVAAGAGTVFIVIIIVLLIVVILLIRRRRRDSDGHFSQGGSGHRKRGGVTLFESDPSHVYHTTLELTSEPSPPLPVADRPPRPCRQTVIDYRDIAHHPVTPHAPGLPHPRPCGMFGYTDSQPASDLTDSQPASDLTDSQPASDHTDSQPASDLTDSQPASDHTDSQPASDLTDSQRASDHTDSQPASDHTDSQPASDLTDSQRASDLTDSQPASDHTDSQPASDHTDSQPASDHTDSQPASDHTDSQRASDHTDSQPASDHTDSQPASDHTDSQLASDHMDIARHPVTSPAHGLPPPRPCGVSGINNPDYLHLF
ncbi:uncharacterized protein LOC143298628 [Babylonia areolata]|uniref:uncharacterized protein LOC143298628 n=1 Tax=Babylonia areolata TaxID=304850 RepID=UPI003FCFEAD1